MLDARPTTESVTVWLDGEIDLARRNDLAVTARGLKHDPRPVVVDVSRVTFCDCTMAAFLADLARDHAVRLRAPTHLTRDLVTVAGVEWVDEST